MVDKPKTELMSKNIKEGKVIRLYYKTEDGKMCKFSSLTCKNFPNLHSYQTIFPEWGGQFINWLDNSQKTIIDRMLAYTQRTIYLELGIKTFPKCIKYTDDYVEYLIKGNK